MNHDEMIKTRITFLPSDEPPMVIIGEEDNPFVMSIGVLRKIVELYDELYGEVQE